MPKISEKILRKFPEIDRISLQLLANRSLLDRNEIDGFLYPDHQKEKYDQDNFSQINKAVETVVRHIKEGNKICIYGDYDADGVTSSALLYELLNTFKANIDIYIPDRVSEGYGLNKKALDQIAAEEVKLIVTVDGGIRNKEEVEYAQKLGLEVIVTDHHTPPDNLSDYPDCIIINPQCKFEKYITKNLAGVGVAYKLAQAMIEKSNLEKDKKEKLTERMFDLVSIGTVADCVALTGENRALVKHGLKILNKTRRRGLIELIKASGLKNGKEIDSWNISFQIAPRLNAAGRMDHANTSFELLVTNDKEKAEQLAGKLNISNVDRQKISDDIFNQVEKQIKSNLNRNILIGVYQLNKNLEHEVWNEGVIGLVAGRLSERYYRPALVITTSEKGYKGSGRSIDEFNIIQALEKCSSYLDKFGGHPSACGFSLKEENIDEFTEKINRVADVELSGKELKSKLQIEAEIELYDINKDLMDQIKLFEPFGEGNPRPKFVVKGVQVIDKITMGADGKHIKFRLKDEEAKFINAIGFGQAEEWKDIKIGDKIDMVFYLDTNEFNGRTEIQLKIIDIKNKI